ncbi:MAG: hypothetical protein WEB04_03740 [Dehalococcoidia bacterium]
METPSLRRIAEGLARRTTRRGLFGRGADVAFGALLGAAAGAVTGVGGVIADTRNTYCAFPGPACPCDGCLSNGMCAKPCIIMTVYYAGGCWVTFNSKLGHNVTCCDCDCNGQLGPTQVCGCGSDWHNNPALCP